jgi:CubicO group peptidase (beta-lactamase class C family)
MLAALVVLSSVVVSGELGTRLDRWIQESGFQGGVLVARNGETILCKGYALADRERGIPYRPDTVFTVGSITKQFTAAAILKLEMQGKIKVEDPIAKYLPGVPEDKRAITLHHLLTHTAGLESDFAGDFDPVERDEYVKRTLASTLRSKPGEAYHYSNSGYSLLGAVVEIASGKPYEKYLRENLFLPAGMKDTGYRLPTWSPKRLAVGYRDKERWGRLDEKPWAKDGPYWGLRANGGIHSTLEDLQRWDRALRGDAILSPEARRKMYTRHVPEGPGADTFYGYGWSLGDAPWGGRYAAHNGGNGIFFADFARGLDDGLVVILSTNDSKIRAGRHAELLARLVHGEDVPPPARPDAPLRALGTAGREAVIRAWIDAFHAEGFEAMQAFRAAHSRPNPDVDDAERNRMLTRMRNDLGRLELLGVAGSDAEGVEVKAKASWGPSVLLRFVFDPGGKLDHINVQVGD